MEWSHISGENGLWIWGECERRLVKMWLMKWVRKLIPKIIWCVSQWAV